MDDVVHCEWTVMVSCNEWTVQVTAANGSEGKNAHEELTKACAAHRNAFGTDELS